MGPDTMRRSDRHAARAAAGASLRLRDVFLAGRTRSASPGQHLEQLWTWWTGELWTMLPARMQTVLRREEQEIVVDVHSRASATLCLLGAGTRDHCAEIQLLVGDGEPAGVPPGLAGVWPMSPARVALRLPRSEVLELVLDLPAATEENLGEVLGFEMDRNTPFRAEQVYFGFDIAGRDRERQRLQVRLRVVPRVIVDAWLKRLAQLGLTPTVIGSVAPDLRADVADGEDRALARIEEIDCGLEIRQRQWTVSRLVQWGAAAVLTLAVVTGIALPLYDLHSRAAELELRVAQAKVQADRVLRTLDEMKELRERAEFVVMRKSQAPTIVEMLAELARIFPDDTWVSRFEVTGEDVRIQGESASASSLIALVEESSRFRSAQFASPVTRNQSTDRDRFVIAAKVEEIKSPADAPDSHRPGGVPVLKRGEDRGRRAGVAAAAPSTPRTRP